MKRMARFADRRSRERSARGPWIKRALLILGALALSALVSGAPAQAVSAIGTAPGSPGTAVLDVVVLADESGSETAAKVADERQTAGTIVQTLLNPASRVTVIGFGGVNHLVPGQSPVDVVCLPTIARPASLGYLASCVNRLHRRSEAEGDDTDYAAALGQAISYFDPDTTFGRQSPPNAIKVILMMTDGGVDVSRDTQQYGTNWRLAEQQAVRQQLDLAQQRGVQVWPLGFGTDIDQRDASYLNQLAKGGAQAGCDTRRVSEPHYQVVNNPAGALNALDQFYAEAGCLGMSATSPVAVGGAQAGTLQVTVPSIASAAAISVDRGNPGIEVRYYEPDGQQWMDMSAISGQGTPVQVLHLPDITRAETGTWRIQLRAAPGLAGHAQATVFWQGAVRALVTANPPSARPGEPIDVTLSVLGPHGPVTDPSTLKQLRVGISVSGDGLSGSRPLPHTDGTAGSQVSVGEYRSRFVAPRQPGTLTFTGTAAGYGLYATKVPAAVQVSEVAAGFSATVSPPAASSVQVGQTIRGHVDFGNLNGSGRRVRLTLNVRHATASIGRPAGPLAAGPGLPSEVPFTITFGRGSSTGVAWLEVKVIDAANPDIVYCDVPWEIEVIRPLGVMAQFWPEIVGLPSLVLLVLASWLLRAAYRKRVDVRGLIAVLRRDGKQLGPEHRISGAWSKVHRFIIHDEDGPAARIADSRIGLPAYTVSRERKCQVKLITPNKERYDITVGERGRVLDHNGLELSFKDTRGKRATLPVNPPRIRRHHGDQSGSSRLSRPDNQRSGVKLLPGANAAE